MSESEHRSDDRAPAARPAHLPRRAWLIRLLFLSVILVIIPNHLYRERNHSDWYPSLLMPAFTGALCDADGRFTYQRIELEVSFADGSRELLTPAQLLPDISVSQAQAIVRRNLMNFPPRPAPRESLYGRTPTQRWFREHIIPGYVQGRLRREYWGGVDPRTIEWLRDAMQSRYPGRKPARLVVRVHRVVMTDRDTILKRDVLYEAEEAL